MSRLWIRVCAVLLLLAAAAAEEVPQVLQQGAEDADVVKQTADADGDVQVEVDEEATAEPAASTDEAQQEWKYDKNDILILTGRNFDRAIDVHDNLFVVFNTPACSTCIKLHPHFVTAWKALRQKSDQIQFAKIDATNETSLLVHYGITQYPTLTLFKNQKEKMFDGGYSATDIEAWVAKRMGAPALPLTTVEELEAARQANQVIVVGFFRDIESVSAIIYNRVADAVHDYPFYFAIDETLYDKYEVTEDAVVVFKQFDDGRVDFAAGDYVADDLMHFLRLETFPLVSELNINNVWRVTEEASVVKTHFLVFRNASNPATPAGIADMLLPAARQHKGSILFLMIDMADRRMFHMEEFFGVYRDALPAMRIFRYEGPTYKFRPTHDDGTISEDLIMQFSDDFITGKLSTFTLAQPLPEDWDAAPVKILTASNYVEMTSDAKHHIFVMLHAPWCPQCQLAGPVYEQLADLYTDHEDVMKFAKMDATANEVEGLEFQSFPTFYLYHGDAERQQFNSSRTISDFVQFLDQYTTVRLDSAEKGDEGATCDDDGGAACAKDEGPESEGDAEPETTETATTEDSAPPANSKDEL